MCRTINGVLCHETGCPDAWKDKKHECRECGSAFEPENRYQEFCGDACFSAYRGIGDSELSPPPT